MDRDMHALMVTSHTRRLGTMVQSHNPDPSSSPSEILRAHDLRKSYGPRPALRGLSFSLDRGRILGFLGPTGGGKTPSIRILTTILEPDAGHFIVDGVASDDPQAIRSRIGVLPESLGFPRHMTGIEFLTFFGQPYGRTARQARTYGMALLEEGGMEQRAKSVIGTYSRGMRQRLGIARALVNDPAVVFLDEPTLGLDTKGQQELLALVQWIARVPGGCWKPCRTSCRSRRQTGPPRAGWGWSSSPRLTRRRHRILTATTAS